MFQGIPGIERAPNGRLWAVWYGGGVGEGDENYVMLVTSADDGRTWSDLKLVIDPPDPVRAFDPCLWHDPRGRLWLFWAQSYHHFDGRAGVWAILTSDSGSESPTWSEPRRLCNGVVLNKPTVLGSGEWLLPACVWGASKRTDVPEQEKRPNVFVSTDRGATWARRGGPVVPEGSFSEHMVVEKNDGRLWMLVRTDYGIGVSDSADKGRTWGVLGPSQIQHATARFFIRRLLSGNLLLVKHGPIQQRTGRSHLTAYLSLDDGRTWSGGLLLDEREGVSYPDGVQARDGRIYLIYDYSRFGDKQILLAVFEEEDVAKCRAISRKASLRLLVNQATGKSAST
jgi:predicted neuraminidase